MRRSEPPPSGGSSGTDGSDIGVAIIDSGVTSWHDNLTGADGGQRVSEFVDFVNGQQAAYDDYGHGTHVAGIITGNGFDSGGAESGIAPGAHLIALKVLDSTGTGRISDVIAALDYVVTRKDALNIRVINLSVSASVYSSYNFQESPHARRQARGHRGHRRRGRGRQCRARLARSAALCGCHGTR